ncbi:MAG: glycine--tRNA ligase [Minisyncoccia bacterium]
MSILDKIGSLAKRRGFFFPDSEIYGGISGVWDYGPLGVEIKRNIKDLFWKEMIANHENIVGIDASILMNPKVWEASGHLESFTDSLVECKNCHHRFRWDEIVERYKNKCPDCGGPLTLPKKFNLLMETYLGVVEGEKTKTYLRGEITQGVHINFKNILNTTRMKIPFGVIQIGKAFRNEITPSQFTFRSREFEQMELQFYTHPSEANKWMGYWKEQRFNWYLNLGFKKDDLSFKEHQKDELAHYAKSAFDIQYNLDGEWKEMEGIHNRGDWDLKRHQEFSKQDLSYYDGETKEKYLPWIIETSGGVDRVILFLLASAYKEEKERIVLKLNPKIAPYKAAVFPLLANKQKLVDKAQDVFQILKKFFMVGWDDRGNIGKRYYAQDEIGTPFCITIDFESLEKNDVTVRNRDTMKQVRVKIKNLVEYLQEKINGNY